MAWGGPGTSQQGFQQFRTTDYEKQPLFCPKVIFPKGVCYGVLTFYADTEPAAVYLVAKSKQPAETQFHGLGLIAPNIGLGNCLQKNKQFEETLLTQLQCLEGLQQRQGGI